MAKVSCRRELKKFPSEQFKEHDGRLVHGTGRRAHYADSGESIFSEWRPAYRPPTPAAELPRLDEA
ncbi:hypothetical protein V2J56_14530 [Georgenia sp. MJ206]|uniref:hypothetical protein n=1 Tax=Georgenia wangjunii TaxID=3117730 RepID=UPI002F265FE0